MDVVVKSTHSRKNETLLLVSLFIFELSLGIMALTMFLKGERSVAEFLFRPSGMAFSGALCAFVISGAVIVSCYAASRRSSSRNFRLIVAMNLVTMVLLLVTGELAVRASVSISSGYELIGTLPLKPKDWEAIRRYYLEYADQAERPSSFHMYDSDLGWTIRPNSQSADGQYWSSSEGLRAPDENVSFAESTGQTEIALVGDSYTFGQEVRYEESYGYYLEQLLGSQARVLNFGVMGYGVGQMFLRYEKDARPWKPKIVILGFISHDAQRTLWVYPFLNAKRWRSPFPKPRFFLREGELVRMTEPLPTPNDMFSRTSISELPLVELQPEYQPGDWEKRFYHVSYLVRLVETWISHMHDISATDSEEAIMINAEVLKAFVRSVKQHGSIPFVVFFPVGNEVTHPHSTSSLGRQALERAGIDYIDPTTCLLEVDPADRFRPLLHYTAQGNAAVAKCVYEAVKDSLAQPPPAVSSPLRGANDGTLHPHR